MNAEKRPIYGSILVLAATGLLASLAGQAAPSGHPDFNGDGIAELVVGVPGQDLPLKPPWVIPNVGAVSVLYGSTTGVTAKNNQLWDEQATPQFDFVNFDDTFGHAVAWGDFNGDGADDLAIGAPGADFPTSSGLAYDVGEVHVLYGGGKLGLVTSGNQRFQLPHTPLDVVNGVQFELFGYALAAGDFNADGFADLAVGVPGMFSGPGGLGPGAVNILYGSSAGLVFTTAQTWHQDSTGMFGGAAAGDLFGAGLAAGDFNGDGFADLAIGISGKDVSGVANAGAVNVVYGSVAGLFVLPAVLTQPPQELTQDTPYLPGGTQPNAFFGNTLAAGDFNADGRDDLVIGVTGETVGGAAAAGAVSVVYGTPGGLVPPSPLFPPPVPYVPQSQHLHQDTPGMLGVAEAEDVFSKALAVGDFDGDGLDDLAIGIPGEVVDSVVHAGAVSVLYGSSAGLSVAGNELWHQNLPHAVPAAEPDASFGAALSTGDFDGNGRDDLAVAAPCQDVGGIVDAGLVRVLYGYTGGLSASGSQLWHQDTPGVLGDAEQNENFGWSWRMGLSWCGGP